MKIAFAKMKDAIPTTEYATVTSGDIALTITGSGAISSSNTKNVSSEVSAKVEKVNVKVGDTVQQGDVLFVLDSSDLDAQIRNKQKSITNYQKSVNNYQKSINDYQEDLSHLKVQSTVTGYVQNLKVNIGDSVNKNDVLLVWTPLLL